MFWRKKEEIKEPDLEPLTEDEVSEERMTREERLRIWNDLSGIEGYTDMLRIQMQADLLAYFNAPPEQKEMIKGALLRTRYTLNMVQRKGVIAPKS